VTNCTNTSQREPVGAANVTAEGGVVPAGKALQEVVPFVDHRGQPRRARRHVHAEGR
jgi:hypothetical protein